MKRLLALGLAILSLLAAPLAPAFASPLPYYSQTFDTPNSAVNAMISIVNSAFPETAYTAACTGTTTATCTGLRFIDSITGLTTAAGVTSATITITNTNITTTSIVVCNVVGYAGTGNPNAVNVVPAAGSLTLAVQNTHASAALNATVPVACFVYN